MVAGIIGANVAGWVSDLFFQSRRAPVAGLLYLALSICAIGMFFTLGTTTNKIAWGKTPKELTLPDKTTQQFDALEPGDQIVAVAGSEDVKNWQDVGAAVACVPPAECMCETTWDTKNCTCASEPEQTGTELKRSEGFIAATVSALLVGPIFLGKTMPLLAFIASFSASTIAGSIIGVLGLLALRRAGYLPAGTKVRET